MNELLPELDAWHADGVGAARAVVVRVFGSAPRPPGAVLLVADDGRLAGSVSGGCVEGAAFAEVELARTTGRSRVIRYGISDEQAWDVGLACGGTIDVLVEPTLRPEVEAAARERGRAVITLLPADAPGPTLGRSAPGAGFPPEPGAGSPPEPGAGSPPEPGAGSPPEPALSLDGSGALTGSSGDPAVDAELAELAADALFRGTSRTVEAGGRSWFVESFPQRPRLVIVGAVQVAISLVALARTLGYETVVIDGRASFATRERFPDADEVIVGWPDRIADSIGLGPSDAVAVLTHDVKFDEPAIVEALARGCRYVGAVGSRKTQADRRTRLLEAGVAPDALARLRGPIGLDLGGREPAETALSIMSEVIASRYGASGSPMSSKAAS